MTEKEKLYDQFKSIFNEYYQSLCNYAYSFIKEKQASEDIVQEIFLRVWEKRPDIITSDSVRFYLFTSVRNNSISFIENKKKYSVIPDSDRESILATLAEEKQEDEPADNLALIKKGLSLLPPKCKDTFLLSRIGKLSYKEIANAMGISVKTVENQIGKAIKILRDFMKEQKVISLLGGIVLFHVLYKNGIGDFTKLLFY